MSENNGFSNNEVAALIESFRHEISAVAEGVTALRVDMDDVKERLSNVEVRLVAVEDGVRIGFPAINKRLDRVEIRLDGVENRLSSFEPKVS